MSEIPMMKCGKSEPCQFLESHRLRRQLTIFRINLHSKDILYSVVEAAGALLCSVNTSKIQVRNASDTIIDSAILKHT